MRTSILYKIGSVVISIIAYLIMLGGLFNILNIGAQPMIIFMFLITLAVVIYVTLCFKLTRIIDYKQPLQRRTKDWIKVNGFVGLGFCLLMILGCLNFLATPGLIDRIYTNLLANVRTTQDISFFKNILHTIIISMLVYAILLVIHIITSLIYISRYSKLSKDENASV